jgi:flagellar basal-body rod modification protein FlgD
MAAFVSGIFNHAVTAAQSFSNTNPTSSPAPQAAGADGASSTSTSSATISANDFLTLLVTEMKNQDPTANTDPNEYINQLVNVNSLEQLIDINQNLSSALGKPSSNSSAPVTGQIPAATTAHATSSAHGSPSPQTVQSATSTPAAGNNLATFAAALKRAPGNLAVPEAIPAAHSIASALGGKPHAHSIAGGPR